ncbi:Unknown protein [Striga hermonthica]|uniref:HTH three-helical bundle domain-containing protein n=1 Tax=Striga hermonthica TaxID=68872 RepID=A0A9N7RSI0_STRHE|nr:Unknown protein [Striga hermonthica]
MAAKTVEASFPSNLERSVASSLLYLSKSESSGSPESLGSSGFSTVKSTGGSAAAAKVCVDEESSPAQLLTVVAFVSESDELEVKIVRKKRSETVCMSRSKKPKTSKSELTSPPSSSESVSGITTVEASCFSSSSSAQSFCSQIKSDDNRRSVGTGHLGRKATAILGVLSYRSASEVEIRHLLGDTPTTSKALRMLLKLEEVKRYGTGGRWDPYIYTIAN